jgi:uncharacterized OB-fold protein
MSASATPSAPLIAPENREFWQAAAAGRLLLRYCLACARPHWYPRAICPRCFAAHTEWRPASGSGLLYSYTVVNGVPPVIPAYVQLQEGVTLLSWLVHCDPAQVRIGMPVSATFVNSAQGQAVPVFQPAADRHT